MWAAESIPNSAILYVRVYYQKVDKKTNTPAPSAFYNTPRAGQDLSSDWNKYSNPKQSRLLIGKEYKFGKEEFKNHKEFFICSMSVKKISRLENQPQTPKHTPKYKDPEPLGDPNNKAHTGIFGIKDEETRLKMSDFAKWEIFSEKEFEELKERDSSRPTK